MKITIHLPGVLRPSTGGQGRIDVDASTVSGALEALVTLHPSVARYVSPKEGKLPNYVRVFVGDRDVNGLQGLETPLKEGDVLRVIPAIAGG
ncbi:MAG TPA: MoaD/ThiS family protein [Thermoplasmata archaeon]|nr:MoaD/ThiS family protein [Thermoplasmata archaeon]